MEILILGLLLVLGIILILIETLFIPGTTIFGILGIISIFSSDYLSYVYFGTEFAIIYSIINSVVSCSTLQPIKRLGIPTITLVHEFSSYIRPESVVNTIGLWSNKIVFSTELTKNDLISKYPQISGVEYKILPQGKCQTKYESGIMDELNEKAKSDFK